MSALDRPTADELARGAIAAAVRNGELTPQEAQARLFEIDAPEAADVLGQVEHERAEWARLGLAARRRLA